jgi:hypothetical protein
VLLITKTKPHNKQHNRKLEQKKDRTNILIIIKEEEGNKHPPLADLTTIAVDALALTMADVVGASQMNS